MTKKLLFNIFMIIVLVGIGVFIGTKLPSTSISQNNAVTPNGKQSDSFQAGWNAAKERLNESGLYPIISGEEIKSVNGNIVSISGNKITLKIVSMDPLSDPALDERIVTINSDTITKVQKNKSPEQIQKEMEEFDAMVQNATSETNVDEVGLTAVEDSLTILTAEEFDIKRLKKGDQLNVTANENIKEVKEFVAKEIIINSPAQTIPIETPEM